MPPTREFLNGAQVLCCFPTMVAFTYKLMAKTVIYSAEKWGDWIIKFLHMQRKHKTSMVVLAFFSPAPNSSPSLQRILTSKCESTFHFTNVLIRETIKSNPIALDTKMQGTGCVTKVEKDNEQILWFAGIISEFLAVHFIPSSFHLVLQMILKSVSKVFFLSCN